MNPTAKKFAELIMALEQINKAAEVLPALKQGTEDVLRAGLLDIRSMAWKALKNVRDETTL